MRHLIILFVILFVFGCKEQESNTSQGPSQMQQVMTIHDEVMPKMGTIGSLVAELKPISDTIADPEPYNTAIKDLQDAHQSMMDWMRGFGERFDSEEIMKGKELSQQKKEWLDEEEEKVKALKTQINSSIEQAQNLLDQTNSPD
ncbi:hypothetical protein [Robertkochia aurantiaca]|uniref:hypothetical protein n=1 Tax=Robertkochia aurantiaca TaxID=2873700 RepID=UPI001CC90BED|nr:hypothetical protein [Robertkochia sp. 3YJGBD-33]